MKQRKGGETSGRKSGRVDARTIKFGITSDEVRMVETLKAATGMVTSVAVFRLVLRQAYEKAVRKSNVMPNAREAREVGKKAVCDLLEGTVTQDGNCRYVQHQLVAGRVFSATQEVPMEALGDWHVKNRFRGGKREEIEALLEKTKGSTDE